MGVHGLWDLLSPVGRRVSVETLAGKRLAIDASIWMVQFMKAMRDERGEMVRNAHLIGFFRRICKLLFLRTKPVFVFDGGTPALKRRTVVARRRQRENAQAKIRKTAEKLLLNHVKALRLKELPDNLQDQKVNSNSKDKTNSKGKEVLLDKSDSLRKNEAASESHNQEMVDEMLAASIVAEESGALGTASSSAAEIGSCSGASASTTVFPQEDGDDEDDEEMILPIADGNVDPAVLAALPPSMQLDLLVQMRERLMAENRQKYQKVKKAPQNFSELQIEAYLKTVAFRREIDQVQKAAAGKGVGGVQTSRIASESNREFFFSSSFSGDKQLLASGGTAKIPENQQRVEKKDSSFDILNAMTSVTKSSTEAEPAVNKDVEIFVDERGHRRVSKSRAMGIRMTRDLQRNIDLMKEHEEEKTPGNIEANTQVNPGLDGQSGKSNCYGESFEAVNEFNRDVVPNSIAKSSLEPEIPKEPLKNENCIEISFDDDGKLRSLDDDDEFFAHLVAGDQVPVCSVDNTTSDCEWEDVGISRESGSLIGGNKLESVSLHARDENENECDVEWIEGTSVINEKFSMKTFDAESRKDKDIGVESQEGHVGDIHEDDRLFTVDVQKIDSKGSAEEEAALQEAIRRSLEDSTGGKSSFVSGQLKVSDYACNRQLQLKSCSSLPISQVERDLGCDKHSQPIVSECDHSSFVAGKDTDASSSLGMHSTPAVCVAAGTASHIDMKNINEQQQNKFVENAQITNGVKSGSSAPADMAVGLPGIMAENFVDDVVINRASSINNSGKLNEYSSGQTASVSEEQILHSDVKETVGEDDTSPVSVQEQSHDAETPAFKDKENTLEPLGSSFEDELLVLGEEYKNLGDEQRKLERNADSVNAEMFVECQELLQMFGLPYIIAPMEAEAQCAFMELASLVDGVVTDDSDVFLFGAKSVYKNIFDDRKYVETYFMKDIESELGLDREKLIHMALLLGSDYTEGVSGIGIVNAIEVVNAFPEEGGLHKFRDWIESPDPAILGKVGGRPGSSSKKKGSNNSKNGMSNSKVDGEGNAAAYSNTLLEHEDDEASNGIQKTKQIFMNKHRNVSKNWHVPASFPSDAVISAYATPQVDKSNEPFAWGKPDIFSLRRLCWEKFAWASQKADELLLPVLKEYNKHETQLRLEAFYTFNERFAKIRSKRIQKAVKGIAGKQSLDLDVADGLQETAAKRQKTKGANGNRRKKSLSKREEHVGERKNSAKKFKSQQDVGDQKEGLLAEAESMGLCTEAEKQDLNDAGGRGRGGQRRRQGKTSVKSSRRKVNSDSECDTSSNRSSDEAEHELLVGNVQLPDSVRRSKRVRQPANYLEEDGESDGIEISVNSKNMKYSDDGANEQKSSCSPSFQEAEVTNASDEREFNSDNFPEHGSPGNYIVKGDGFCAEEDDAEKESHSAYLQMGGGFCLEDEDDLDFRECDGGGGSTITDAYISSTLIDTEEAGPTISPREIVPALACVQDTVQGLQKGPLSDSHLNLSDKHEATDSNLSNVAVPVNDDAPTTVNPFSAIPYLKRKRRKT